MVVVVKEENEEEDEEVEEVFDIAKTEMEEEWDCLSEW